MALHTRPGRMTQHHDVIPPRQPRIDIRLLSMDIQPRTAHPPLVQRLHQRLLIHQLPPRHIHQPSPKLEHTELLPRKEYLPLKRRSQNDTIAAPQQLLQPPTPPHT
ncbi:hypothetical protein GRF29_8g1082685 [Pseudopithomyces chartarum]|uniref:Uncharacterized protein n=1 Tax=Pseudopithomyces chartarum TaxID=1892770 RepID=A0AAN6M5U5_9PLEO|nr:hypothetical protein GRF29_8g1082685 [Pseudopithomyces chartarum]